MSILALTSDTLIVTPASGNLEYNGQFFGTDSNASRAQMQRIVQETAQATTSGTSKDFTSIPAWVKRITVMFAGVSTSGTSVILIQLGDAGGIETSGYTAASFNDTGSSSSTPSTGFAANPASVAAANLNGAMTITSMGSNIFSQTGTFYRNNTNGMAYCAGTKTLSDTLTQIRITTVNGTDTFDAGSVNIIYEG